MTWGEQSRTPTSWGGMSPGSISAMPRKTQERSPPCSALLVHAHSRHRSPAHRPSCSSPCPEEHVHLGTWAPSHPAPDWGAQLGEPPFQPSFLHPALGPGACPPGQREQGPPLPFTGAWQVKPQSPGQHLASPGHLASLEQLEQDWSLRQALQCSSSNTPPRGGCREQYPAFSEGDGARAQRAVLRAVPPQGHGAGVHCPSPVPLPQQGHSLPQAPPALLLPSVSAHSERVPWEKRRAGHSPAGGVGLAQSRSGTARRRRRMPDFMVLPGGGSECAGLDRRGFKLPGRRAGQEGQDWLSILPGPVGAQSQRMPSACLQAGLALPAQENSTPAPSITGEARPSLSRGDQLDGNSAAAGPVAAPCATRDQGPRNGTPRPACCGLLASRGALRPTPRRRGQLGHP